MTVATPREPRQYAKTAKRREQILAAAVDVFGSQGYRAGTLRQIADAVGITQAGLLHHFGSKEGLLFAVLDRRDTDGRQIMDRAFAEAGTLEAVVTLMRHNESIPGLLQLHLSLEAEAVSPDHPAHDYFQRRTAASLAIWNENIARDQQLGRIRNGPPADQIARFLVALMEGIQVLWLVSPTFSMAADVAAQIEWLRTA